MSDKPILLSEEETLYKYLVLVERRVKRISRITAEAPGVASGDGALDAYLPLVRAAIQNPQLYAEFQERAYKGEFLLEEYTGKSSRPDLLFPDRHQAQEDDYSDFRIEQIVDALVDAEALDPKAGWSPGQPGTLRSLLRDHLAKAQDEQDALPEDGVVRFWEDALSRLTAEMLAELNGDVPPGAESTN